jgi:hypothetical protein
VAARSSLWLSAPTRFVASSPRQARAWLAVVAAGLVALVALSSLWVPLTGDRVEPADPLLHDQIVSAMKGGLGYYEAAIGALRTDGAALLPIGAVRLPALAAIEAQLPYWAPLVLLFALATAAGTAWGVRLGRALAGISGAVAAWLLLVASLLPLLLPQQGTAHALWAALIVALALAIRRPGRWLEAAALGLAAMLIHEVATLFAAVMALIAWREREAREALGWAAALALFGTAFAVHVHALTGLAGPLSVPRLHLPDPASTAAVARSLLLDTGLRFVPAPLAALLVGVALLGWAGWRDGLGARMLALAAAAMLTGASTGAPAAALLAPVLLLGLVFAPDAVRDLVVRALDRRRITVTRVTR